MRDQQFAIIGAGFWSKHQLAAWSEIPGARCVAVCDLLLDKAQSLANQFGVPHVCDDVEQLLDTHAPDFVDIVTSVESHVAIAKAAIRRGVAAICQKPLAESVQDARTLCILARTNRVPLLVHENWRWQAPIRRLKQLLDSEDLGELVRARIDYANSFPVFDNQPALKELEQFILTDIGTHILDVSRFLFGEADELYCQTRKMRSDIAGEDVATVVMRMQSGLTVTCNMSYASHWEFDRFPQTMLAIEGTRGGVSLGTDYLISVYGKRGERRERVPIPQYAWANPAYALIHSSIVECHRNLLAGLRGELLTETTAEDNLRTLELVAAAYSSATRHQTIAIDHSAEVS